jgi:uncharacterized membrane protein YdbT with pleckstrin-like domain
MDRLPEEHVCLDARCHGVVLAGPLAGVLAVAAAGFVLLFLPWPAPLPGALLAIVAAVWGCAAVWRWDSTRLVVTTEKIFLVRGVLRRHESAVVLRSVQSVGVEQSLPGRAMGYGTLSAGPLRVEHVPDARRVGRLVESLCG